MGTEFSEYRFHTFQNGLCYELAFVLSEIVPGMSERKSRMMREMDEWNLVQPLIRRVQFSRPTAVPVRKNNPQAVPHITRFVASSQTANDDTNRGQITFSWTARNTDYVDLSCKYVPALGAKIPATVMVREGYPCYHASWSLNPKGVHHLPPNAAQTWSFISYRGLYPARVVVTLTPFAYGKVYTKSARSFPIQVNPYNQFPDGVPEPDGKVVLSYPVRADGTTKLRKRSSLTIHWTEATPRDSCVNLYLVQDVGAGKWAYRMQLPNRCFSPAKGGSHTWTIPDRFSGAGFRIYAREPGGPASGWGTPFSIIPATAGR